MTEIRKRRKRSGKWSGILLFFILIISCESIDVVSISQISPKSNNIPNISERVSETVTSSSSSSLSSPTKFSYSDTIQFLDISPSSTISSLSSSLNFNDDSDIDNIEEHQQQQQQQQKQQQQQIQSRIQRSALPILNDLQSKSNLDLINLQQNDVTETAGRYFNYIKPTSTVNNIVENGDITKSQRNTKDNNMDFLSKRGPRLQISGPLSINPTTVIQTTETVISTNKPNNNNNNINNNNNNNNNNPRQNHNPDIQDIITGIVKLLNGNVNVHANTQQAQRRPVASRINNRGPPRISEAQPLPIDYDVQKPNNNSPIRPLPPPPPYPFDRPDNAVRPYVSGIPIPEQIVPSIQQNYRPSFISQNRPPWHRPRPRPPFGSRRPIPSYKPLPHQIDNYNPDEELQITTVETDDNNNNNNNETIELNPTDSTYDGELLNLEKDESSLSVTKSNDNLILNTSDTASVFVKKDEHTKKKDNVKHKSTEKKPITPITKTTSTTTDDMTTIIQSTSVVHTAQVISSTMEQDLLAHEMIPSIGIETSIDDISSSLSSSINSEEEPMTALSSSLSSSSTLASPTTMKTTPLPNVSSSVSFVPSTSSSTLSSITSNTVSPSGGTTTTTTSSITTTSTPTTPLPISTSNNTLENGSAIPYHPRPGIVLDDPEFKPGGHGKITQQRPQRPIIQPTRHHHLPPAYGEIFDVTLSAIQGPGSLSGSQQTINIKPYGFYGNNNNNGGGGSGVGNSSNEDIIISPSGDEGFVSIDGKRTYINLFGELTDTPVVATNSVQTIRSSQSGSSSSSTISSTDYITHLNSELSTSIQPTKSPKPHVQSTQKPSQRPHYRPRTTQPPVRIDTCIVGDDSTCDQAQNEKCKTENGVSSCHCRPGYSRRKHREPCRKVVSFFISMRVDRIYERRIVWDKLLMDKNSEPYDQLSFESVRAIDSAMSMTPFSDEFIEAKVNNIYRGDISQGTGGVFVNLTLRLEENAETLRQNLRNDIQKHLIGVLHRRNNNIGNSVLYVDSPIGSISNLHDLDECQSKELNDCHINAICTNMWGSFRCECEKGYRDPWSDQQQRAGKECLSCPESHCNNRGICNYEDDGTQTCTCTGSYYGSQCEIDGEVLGVAIGASVAAVIIIVLTLICLIMWSRKWHREQKNTLGSPIFGYMTTGPVKSSITTQSPYQVTLDDRMRWAQIADVMAQANHYAAEPVAPPRPSSAMFGYPNLQAMNMGTMGGMSIAGTLPMHSASSIPPVPLPRLGLSQRSNGMRTLENSSSSEEEDRTDLLGRNFQVPRPKSRSNGSIANQSGIYYDVDYEPSGGIGDIYGTATTSVSNTLPGSQGIPMSTYTSGRTPSAYYIKR